MDKMYEKYLESIGYTEGITEHWKYITSRNSKYKYYTKCEVEGDIEWTYCVRYDGRSYSVSAYLIGSMAPRQSFEYYDINKGGSFKRFKRSYTIKKILNNEH